MAKLQDDVEKTFASALQLVRGTSLFELQSTLLACQERLSQPMQIAIIGEISSSKSTLVNALLKQEEVVRTGALEETFNVSWLKFGSQDAPITVHYKSEENQAEQVSRKEWQSWANRMGMDSFKSSVSYLEVEHDSPMLRTFNIIDTPGLNAHLGTDSQNTLDFLQLKKPDAIVLVFTKSIAQDSVALLKTFNSHIPGNMSPINTIGVLSKVDSYWPAEDIPLEAGQRVCRRLMDTEPSVKSALFALTPLSARMALGSLVMDDEDFNAFTRLAELDSDRFIKMIATSKRFTKALDDFSLSSSQRKKLLEKYSRYGVSFAVSQLSQEPRWQLDDLRQALLKVSGYPEFMETLTEHFGNRAYLVKLSTIQPIIAEAIQQARLSSDVNAISVLPEIERLFETLMSSRHEFRELQLLQKYYEGSIDVSQQDIDELLRVSGEYGDAYCTRLGLSVESDIEAMLKLASERIQYWRARVVKAGVNHDEKLIATTLQRSYRYLYQSIEQAADRLHQSSIQLWGKPLHKRSD